jgi:NADH-quinone oxidoreductase subunit N
VLGAPEGTAFGGQIASDAFTRFMKVFTLGGAALACCSRSSGTAPRAGALRVPGAGAVRHARHAGDDLGERSHERSTWGSSCSRSRSTSSPPSTATTPRSAEAGLKYFVLGALSSGLLLYGMSLVYGFAGTTNFDRLADAIAGPANVSAGVIVGMVFMIAGLTFKVAAVPFHMWTPDVYEGAPASVVAYFATATKVGAIAVIVRVMAGPFGGLADQWQQVMMLASLGSMLLGAFAAHPAGEHQAADGLFLDQPYGLRDDGPRRRRRGRPARRAHLHADLPDHEPRRLRRARGDAPRRAAVERGERPRGPRPDRPGMALWMAVFMFSMAGIPPLAGFFAKLFVFKAAIEAGFSGRSPSSACSPRWSRPSTTCASSR